MKLVRALLILSLMAAFVMPASSATPVELCKPRKYFTSKFDYNPQYFHGETTFDLTRCWNIKRDFEARARITRYSPTDEVLFEGGQTVVCRPFEDGGKTIGDCHLTYGSDHELVDHSRYKVRIQFRTRSGAKKSFVIFDGTCTSTAVSASCE